MKAVNLLPSDQRGPAKAPAAAKTPASSDGSAFGAWLVIGALGFALAATAAFVLVSNQIKDRRAELARVKQEVSVTQARAAALQSFADFQELAKQRVSTVRGLAQSRFDWERTLQDLSRALPSNVYLSKLTGSTNVGSGGGGGNVLRGAIQAPAVEMAGCTGSQHDVAELMSRLRNVRGVTRVTLSSSDKDTGGSAAVATSSSTPGDIPAQPCPKGSPPAFNLVVFFERALLSPDATVNLPGGAPSAQAQASGAAATQSGSSSAAPAADSQTPSTTVPSDPAVGTTQGVSAK